ncbi:uncharacterized protein MICPUCDRAFT_62915 [Micromonas pusilla CCMP1545]|uniref:Predicted protein n=1 Tax=Micromonas pusilla (strain CCMP1545) TaxID=564608 RepID=C1N0S5_MICPC|nr:uncharacterized protein MICPUCDRAFT_62915 [Micromonas pusilla CCMP1545]EEH54072.1 predicted protein [Micromonas pusilla CCMP1545]|eukprot:XP_003061442.1 predicted protein [Micromonas pusilla CCMP1545]
MNQKMEWSIDRSVVRSNRRTRRERGRGARARRERGAARVRRATLAVESAGAPRTTDASPERRRERRGSRAARSNDDARRGRALRGAKTGRAALCGRDCGGAGGVGRPSSARLAGGKIVDWRRWSWSERQPASCVVNQFQSSRARRVRRSALSTSWACTRRNGRADAGPGSD